MYHTEKVEHNREAPSCTALQYPSHPFGATLSKVEGNKAVPLLEDHTQVQVINVYDRLDRLENKVDKVLSLFEQNESRLKSLQHRVNKTEGRDETAARDIYSIRMLLMRQETQTKSVISTLKIFGSIATVLSVLVNIGRMIFL